MYVGISQVGLRVPLGDVDEIRILGRVPDEEDWMVQKDQVQDAFLSPQFDSYTMRVTDRVGGSHFSGDSGKTDGVDHTIGRK